MGDWIHISEVNEIPDDVQCIHCDTRDFHVIMREEEIEGKDDKGNYLPWWSARDKEQFLIHKDKLIPFLQMIEEISGGRGEWRHLSFEGIMTEHGAWFKYIRFYRVSPTQFIVTDGRKAQRPENMTEKTLNKSHLNFMED